jgi:hypothetical protein
MDTALWIVQSLLARLGELDQPGREEDPRLLGLALFVAVARFGAHSLCAAATHAGVIVPRGRRARAAPVGGPG